MRTPSDPGKLRALLDDYCITSPPTVASTTPVVSVTNVPRPPLMIETPATRSPRETPSQRSLSRSGSPVAQEVDQVHAITDSLLSQIHCDAEQESVTKLLTNQKLKDGLEQVGEKNIREGLEQHFDLQRMRDAAERLPHIETEYEKILKETDSLKVENKALKAETRLLQRDLGIALNGEIPNDETTKNPRLRAFKKSNRHTLPSIKTGKVAEDFAKTQSELSKLREDFSLFRKELEIAKKTSKEDCLRATDAEEKMMHAMKSCKDATTRATTAETELSKWIENHTHEISLQKEKLELEAAITGTERKLTALSAELQLTVDKNVLLSEDLDVSRSRCQILEKELRQLGTHLEQITSKNAANDLELANALAQISNSTQQLTDNDRLFAENRRVAQENVTLNKRAKDLTSKLGKAEAQLSVNSENEELLLLLKETAPGREALEKALKEVAAENEGLTKLAIMRSNAFRDENNKGVQTTHVMGEGYLATSVKTPGMLSPSDIWVPTTPRKRSQTTVTSKSVARKPSNEPEAYWYQLHSKKSNLERHRDEIVTALGAIKSGEMPHGWEGMIPRAKTELERLGKQGGIMDTDDILTDPAKALECELDMVQTEMRLTEENLRSAITERRAGLAAAIAEDDILGNLQLELKTASPSPSPRRKNIVSVSAASCTFQPPSAKISLTICGLSEPAYVLPLSDMGEGKSPAVFNIPSDGGRENFSPGLDLRVEVLDGENTILGVTEQYIVPYTGGREKVAVKIEGMHGSLVLNIHNAVTKLDVLSSRGVDTTAISQPEPLIWIQTPRQFTGAAALTRMLQQRHIKHVTDIEIIHVDVEAQILLLRVLKPRKTATSELIFSIKSDIGLAVGCGTGVPRIERLDKKNVAAADEWEPSGASCSKGIQTVPENEYETMECVHRIHSLSVKLDNQLSIEGLGTGCNDTDGSLSSVLCETYSIIRKLTKQAFLDASPPRTRISYSQEGLDTIPGSIQELFSEEFTTDSLYLSKRISSCCSLLSRIDPPYCEAVYDNVAQAFCVIYKIAFDQSEENIPFDDLVQCAVVCCRRLSERIKDQKTTESEVSFSELFLLLKNILLSNWQPSQTTGLQVNHVVSIIVDCCRRLIDRIENDHTNDIHSDINDSLPTVTAALSALKSCIESITWQREEHSSVLKQTYTILNSIRLLDDQLESEGIGSGNIEVDLEVANNLQEAKRLLLKAEKQAKLDASPPRTRKPITTAAVSSLLETSLQMNISYNMMSSAYSKLFNKSVRSKKQVRQSLSVVPYKTPVVSSLWYWFSKWCLFVMSETGYSAAGFYRLKTEPLARQHLVTVSLTPHHATAVECTAVAIHYPADNPKGIVCGFGEPQPITIDINSSSSKHIHLRWSVLHLGNVVSTGYQKIEKKILLDCKSGVDTISEKMTVLLDKNPALLHVVCAPGVREMKSENFLHEHPIVSQTLVETNEGVDVGKTLLDCGSGRNISLALKSVSFSNSDMNKTISPVQIDIFNNSYTFRTVDEVISLDNVPTDFLYYQIEVDYSTNGFQSVKYSTVSLLTDLHEVLTDSFSRDVLISLYPVGRISSVDESVITIVLTIIGKSASPVYSLQNTPSHRDVFSPPTSHASEPDEFLERLSSTSQARGNINVPTWILKLTSVDITDGTLSTHYDVFLTLLASAGNTQLLFQDSYILLESGKSYFTINKDITIPYITDSHLVVKIVDRSTGVLHTSKSIHVDDIRSYSLKQITVDNYKLNVEAQKNRLFFSYTVQSLQFDPVLQRKPERMCKVVSALPGGNNSGSSWFSVPELQDSKIILSNSEYVECFTELTQHIGSVPVLFSVVIRCADTPNSVPRDKVFSGILPNLESVIGGCCEVIVRSDGNEKITISMSSIAFTERSRDTSHKGGTSVIRTPILRTPTHSVCSDDNDNDEGSPKHSGAQTGVQKTVLKRLQTRRERKQKQLNSSLSIQKEREPLAKESMFDNSFGTADDILAASFGSAASSRSGFSSPRRRAPRKVLKIASQLAPLTKKGSIVKGGTSLKNFTDSYLAEFKALEGGTACDGGDLAGEELDHEISPTLPPLPQQGIRNSNFETRFEDEFSLDSSSDQTQDECYPNCLWEDKLEPHVLPSWDPIFLYPKREVASYTEIDISGSAYDHSSFIDEIHISELSESRMDSCPVPSIHSLVCSDHYTTMNSHVEGPRSPFKRSSIAVNNSSQTTITESTVASTSTVQMTTAEACTYMTPLESYSMSMVDHSGRIVQPGSPRKPICVNKYVTCDLQSDQDINGLLNQLAETTTQRNHAERSADGLLKLVQDAAAREEDAKKEIAELQSKIECHQCNELRRELHTAERFLKKQEEAILTSVASIEAAERRVQQTSSQRPKDTLPGSLREYFNICESCPDEHKYNEMVIETQQLAKEASVSQQHRLNSMWALIASQEKMFQQRDKAAESAIVSLLADPVLYEMAQKGTSLGDNRIKVFKTYLDNSNYETTSSLIKILKKDSLLLSLLYEVVKNTPSEIELPPDDDPRREAFGRYINSNRDSPGRELIISDLVDIIQQDPDLLMSLSSSTSIQPKTYSDHLMNDRSDPDYENKVHSLVKIIHRDPSLCSELVSEMDERIAIIAEYVTVLNKSMVGNTTSTIPEIKMEAAQKVVDVILRDSLLTDLLSKEISFSETEGFDIIKSLTRYVQYSNTSDSWCRSPVIEKKRIAAATSVVQNILNDELLCSLLQQDKMGSIQAAFRRYNMMAMNSSKSDEDLRKAAHKVVDELLCDKVLADVTLSKIDRRRSNTPLTGSTVRSFADPKYSISPISVRTASDTPSIIAPPLLRESVGRQSDTIKELFTNYQRAKETNSGTDLVEAAASLAQILLDDDLLHCELKKFIRNDASQAANKLQQYELLQKSTPTDDENKSLVDAINELSVKNSQSEYQQRSLHQLYETASHQQDVIRKRDVAAVECITEILKDDILKGTCQRLLTRRSQQSDLIEKISEMEYCDEAIIVAASKVLAHPELADQCKQIVLQQDVVSRILGIPSQASPRRSQEAVNAAVDVIKEDKDLVNACKSMLLTDTNIVTNGLLARITGQHSSDEDEMRDLAVNIILSDEKMSSACQRVLISSDLITRITGTLPYLQTSDDFDRAAALVCEHSSLVAACLQRLEKRFRSPGIAITLSDGKLFPTKKLISEISGIPESHIELGKVKSDKHIMVISVFADTKEGAEELACGIATRCADPDDVMSVECNVIDVDILESSSLFDISPLEKVDVDNRLAWILKTRPSLVNDIFYLHSSLQLGKEHLPAALHTSNHILSTHLTEVERLHLGLSAIPSSPPDTKLSQRQIERLMNHSSATSPTRLRFASESPTSTMLSLSPPDSQ